LLSYLPGMRASLLTVSTPVANDEIVDESGPRLGSFADSLGLDVVAEEVVPSEEFLIRARLIHFCDEAVTDLLLTSGGIGFSPDDVTPEATRSVLDREAPGIAEAMRAAFRPHTANWMLSRAVAGTRGRTLIVNFPGNPIAIDQCADAIAECLPNALAQLGGERLEYN
jgi:molybdopterin adenylyltransferase